LNVSERAVYRWIQQGKLPTCKVNEQHRFNRAELLEWATAQRISVSPEAFQDLDHGSPPSAGIEEAIRAGGIHYRVAAADKLAALRAVVNDMPLPEEVDRQFLLQVLLARESAGSTGLGNGIAVPHVRNPIVMHIPRPMITLSFLERAVDFGALDGLPVHTLFTIVSPSIKAHLHLLSRLGFALRQPNFSGVITRQASAEEIFAAAGDVDRSVPQHPNGTEKA
jgi:PTS system nitrogen regulatory IIA component